jgi:hypothetical protein
MEQKFIIGDIVEYNNKIVVIKEPRDGSHFDLSCPKEGLVYCFVDIDEIRQVMITPEILEKNGWKKVSDYNYIHQSRKFRIVSRDRETYKWSIVVDGFGLGEYIGYVSELQHFLFGIRLKRGMEV